MITPNSFDDWVYIIHPDCVRDIQFATAKECWYAAYRAWRRKGKPDMPLLQVAVRFAPDPQAAELGTIDGFRFIRN